ncbi:MAG: bifunctional nuclease family protein [Bacteroidetes bacterium]|nr:bifunctional nuclease family protein [Bacteroidota bacterium]
MSQKAELEILSIVPAHSQGAYTLVLAEKNGSRKLPVLIGGFEAQAIAMELEGMKPSRPLTHDLMVDSFNAFGVEVTEVYIHSLSEGIFFSKILCSLNGQNFELDSRTSDAIALAAKFHCPVYADMQLLDEAAYEIEEHDEVAPADEPGRVVHDDLVPVSKSHSGYSSFSMDELENLLEEAIRDEDYTKAAKIRDEIARRKK